MHRSLSRRSAGSTMCRSKLPFGGTVTLTSTLLTSFSAALDSTHRPFWLQRFVRSALQLGYDLRTRTSRAGSVATYVVKSIDAWMDRPIDRSSRTGSSCTPTWLAQKAVSHTLGRTWAWPIYFVRLAFARHFLCLVCATAS
jgi:hypothetical protein